MPGGSEDIVLNADARPVEEAFEKGNKAAEKYEKTVVKATQTAGEAVNQMAQNVVTGVNDSVAKANTLIAGIERKMRMARAKGDPLERVQMDWEVHARKMRGNDAGLARVNELYSQYSDEVAEAVRATKAEALAQEAATKAKREAAEALAKQNAQLQQYEQALHRVKALEAQARKSAGWSPAELRAEQLREMSKSLRGQLTNEQFQDVMQRAHAADQSLRRSESEELRKLAEKDALARARVTQNLVEQAQYRGADALGRLHLERTRMLGQIDPSDAAAIASINSEFDKLVKHHHELEKQKAFDTQTQKLQNFGGKLQSIGTSLTFMVTLPMVMAGKTILNVASSIERQEMSFEALLRSADKAKSVMGQLMALSGRSVYTFDQLASSAKRMLALGFKDSEIVRMTKALSNAAAGMGGSPELLDRITLALGQMRAKQRVSAEEMRQLSEAGIGAWEMLAERAGVTVPKAMELAEKKMFDAERAVAALTEGIEDRFAGVQDTLANSVYGMQKQVENQFQILVYNSKEVFLPVLKEILGYTRDLVQSMGQALVKFNDLPDAAKKTALALGGITAAAGPMAFLAGSVIQVAANLRILGASSGAAWVLFGGKVALVTAGVLGLVWAIREVDKKLVEFADKWTVGGNKNARNQEIRNPSDPLASVKYKPLGLIPGVSPVWDDVNVDPHLKIITGRDPKASLVDRKLIRDKATSDAENAGKDAARALERSLDILEQAQKKNLEGFDRIDAEYADRVRELGKAPAVLANLQAARWLELLAYFNTETEKHDKAMKSMSEKAMKTFNDIKSEEAKIQADYLKKRGDAYAVRDRTLERVQTTQATAGFDSESVAASRTRDRALMNLELVNGITIQGKIATERQKIAIEEEFAKRSLDIQLRKLDREFQITRERTRLSLLAFPDIQVAVLEQLDREHLQNRQRAVENSEQSIGDIRIRSNIAVNNIIQQQNERTYMRIKDSVGELFDALVLKSRSWGEALKNAFLLPLYAAFKEGITSSVARSLQAGLGGSLTGGLRGGAQGVTRGGVWAQIMGMGGGLGSVYAPTTVPTFPTGSQGSVYGAGGGVGATVGLGATLKGFGIGGLNFLRGLGNIGMKTPSQLDMLNPFFKQGSGVGGWQGGAMLAGGGMLAMDGLRRGGWLGMAETTAGGALIGAKFGGPVGAAIGAGIGAVVGALRMLKRSGEQRVIDKVQQLYRMTIDKTFAKQLYDLAKQSYAGNIDLMLASADARDMLQLYSAMRGADGTFAATMTPGGIVQAGGSLYQTPITQFGKTIPGLGGTIPTLTLPTTTNGTTIQLDGPATVSLLRGEAVTVINNNPTLIGRAVVNSAQSSVARRDLQATQMPGLVLR